MATENLDIMNSYFEEKICQVLECLAPMKTFQVRKNFKNWVDLELKLKMENRDKKRELARRTSLEGDWLQYRALHNECTKLLRKKKSFYIAAIFEDLKQKKM